MRPSRRMRGILYAGFASVLVGASAVAIVAHANGSVSGTSQPTLPPAKQAIINNFNSFMANGNNPHPVPGNPSDVPPAQPCSRDLSVIFKGLNTAINTDFPIWRNYKFNNQWADPSGAFEVVAGNLAGSDQGAVAVETWTPPTSCLSTHAEYVAPVNSGSFTVTGVSGTIVSLSSSAGSSWTFDLTTYTFRQGS